MALVVNAAKSRYFGGWGPTREEAEAAALGRAPGGTIQEGHDHCAGEGSTP